MQDAVLACIHAQPDALWLDKKFGKCTVDNFIRAFAFDTQTQGHSDNISGPLAKTSNLATRTITLNVLEDKAVLDQLLDLSDINGTVALFLFIFLGKT